ncbi:hypothetical protein GWI33_011257 [Rhynchophorus ferrugineus]|uniref:non-specific serine/threonine protein kinase n=1 Tax=Rhynchophorus ferrugineus TaxID=354439 RepID=A0A834M8K2_RHYFE|nr:hypothetical protein GWI33_011257 [Rhynchophorus ferrugineus]
MVRYNALKGLYDIEKTIGCGGFAKVKLATHLATGEKVAIKIMDKQMLGEDLRRVKLELEALKSFSHENICQLYQVIETSTHFFIIMEYCSGGELFDHIVEKNRLNEPESRKFFRQIVSAVAYLHSLGYAHRDLKPENVLLDKNQNLKLIDFGLCAKPQGGIENPLYTSCGSPTYAAPELILGQQYLGQEVDVWAMGVLLYALLAGSLPFDDLNIDNLYRKILNGKYEEPPFISKESLRLIRSMLQVEPKKRIKVTELLDHPWITLGVLGSVQYRPRKTSKYDSECVQVMAKFMEMDEKLIWNELSKWKFDYSTATYLLLLNRKQKDLTLRVISIPALKIAKHLEKPATPLLELPVNTTNNLNDFLTPNQKMKIRRKLGNVAISPNWSTPTPHAVIQDTSSPYGQFLDAPKRESSRKCLKRPRSPFQDEASPVYHVFEQ